MPCLICGGPTAFAFTKTFDRHGLGAVDYQRCQRCGFTTAQHILEMPEPAWEALNESFHLGGRAEGSGRSTESRYLERLEGYAGAIDRAARAGIIPGGRFLDYACGEGVLAGLLEQKGHRVDRHDRYLPADTAGYLGEHELEEGRYALVINTAMFEHVRSVEPLDQLVSLVGPDGVLAVHTLVRERIPDDPAWFYLQPVHSALFTNAAMQQLFERWGFGACVYDVPGKMWFFLRHGLDALPERAWEAFRSEQLVARDGAFVDYWKG